MEGDDKKGDWGMNKRKRIFVAGICTLAVAASLIGCGPKKVENDYVKITGYTGLKVNEVSTSKVNDETVESQMEQLRQNYATYTTITERTAQKGDLVTIDYAGAIDGVAFDGGTASGQQLEIGAGGYIDGFEDGIVGHATGETFDVNTTFPDPYEMNPDLAGKEAVFTITLSKIEEVVLPELNDEFVTMVKGEETTLEDYKKELREILESQAEVQAQSDKETEIMNALLENVEMKKYPKDKVQEYKDKMVEQYQQIATSLNMEYTDFLEQYMGMDEEAFDKEMDTQIKEYVKQLEVLELIAKEEKISVSDEEINKWLKENAQSQQMTEEELKEQLSDEDIEQQVLSNQVISWLWEKAEIGTEDSDN